MNEQEQGWNWFPGIVMVGVGIAILLGYFTDFRLDNWWAYFILIPALGSFGNAWNQYRNDGHLSAGTRGGLFGGLMMTLVAAIFIFDLSWQVMWPVGMILAGLGIIFSGVGRRNKEKTPEDIY